MTHNKNIYKNTIFKKQIYIQKDTIQTYNNKNTYKTYNSNNIKIYTNPY